MTSKSARLLDSIRHLVHTWRKNLKGDEELSQSDLVMFESLLFEAIQYESPSVKKAADFLTLENAPALGNIKLVGSDEIGDETKINADEFPILREEFPANLGVRETVVTNYGRFAVFEGAQRINYPDEVKFTLLGKKSHFWNQLDPVLLDIKCIEIVQREAKMCRTEYIFLSQMTSLLQLYAHYNPKISDEHKIWIATQKLKKIKKQAANETVKLQYEKSLHHSTLLECERVWKAILNRETWEEVVKHKTGKFGAKKEPTLPSESAATSPGDFYQPDGRGSYH